LFSGTITKIITHFVDHVHEGLITAKIQPIVWLIEKHDRSLFQVFARQFEGIASISATLTKITAQRKLLLLPLALDHIRK